MKRFVQTIAIALALVFLTTNVKAQESIMNVGADLGIILPINESFFNISKLGDSVSTSYSFMVNLEYMYLESLGISFSIGYIGWTTKNDYTKLISIPIKIGGRYYFNNKNITPFVGLDLGVFNNKFEQELSYISNEEKSNLGFSILAGALYPVAENISLRGIVSFTNIFTGNENYSDVSYLSVRLGAIYRL
jgi:hypothetical protein